MPHHQPSSDSAADPKKKDPYQEIIEMLESYEEGCAKATMFDALDECCATKATPDSKKELCKESKHQGETTRHQKEAHHDHHQGGHC